MNAPSALAAATLALGAVACGAGGGTPAAEETVEMVTGSFRTVADGRAEILIGEVGDLWREETGIMVDAVEVEVSCGEESEVVWVSADKPTEPVCRIQLELVEITNWSPSKAKITVRWRS